MPYGQSGAKAKSAVLPFAFFIVKSFLRRARPFSLGCAFFPSRVSRKRVAAKRLTGEAPRRSPPLVGSAAGACVLRFYFIVTRAGGPFQWQKSHFSAKTAAFGGKSAAIKNFLKEAKSHFCLFSQFADTSAHGWGDFPRFIKGVPLKFAERGENRSGFPSPLTAFSFVSSKEKARNSYNTYFFKSRSLMTLSRCSSTYFRSMVTVTVG